MRSNDKVNVLGKRGQEMSCCSYEKAVRSVECGHARWVSHDTIVLLLDHRERERIRRIVIARDGLCCHYCHAELTENEITIDHIIPKDSGGSNYPDNLCVCCDECNNRKRNMAPEVFRKMRAKELSDARQQLADD
jgi:5-methylcytosine-specific restriction endonuclease McrA